VTRRRRSARSAVIDACCVIDLLASGNFEAILQSTGHTWHIPVAVQAELNPRPVPTERVDAGSDVVAAAARVAVMTWRGRAFDRLIGNCLGGSVGAVRVLAKQASRSTGAALRAAMPA
jgi:hypothetical protein